MPAPQAFVLQWSDADDVWAAPPALTKEEKHALFRARWIPATPLRFVAHGDVASRDWVLGQHLKLNLVSQRLCSALEGVGATGWTRFSIDLVDESGDSVPGFFGLGVSGQTGELESARALPVIRTLPARSVVAWRGASADWARWDGSDVFVFGNSRRIGVSARAAAGIGSLGRSNVRVVPMSEFETTTR